MTSHTYYLAASRRVIGTDAHNLDTRASLLADYLRAAGVADPIGRYDGASTAGLVVVGCNGAGTGRVIRIGAPP